MKIELSYAEALAISRALRISIHKMEKYAEDCIKWGMEDDAKYWNEEAEDYRKTYKAVEAQRARWLEKEQGQ